MKEFAGTLDRDMLWQGVVRVKERVFIPKGVTLSIQDNTVVLFDGSSDASLEVRGTLIASGELGREVRFYPTGEWGGIQLKGGSRDSVLKHVWVDGFEGPLIHCAEDAHARLWNLRLRRGGTAVHVSGQARLSLRFSEITEAQHMGLWVEDNAAVEVEASAFNGNATGVMVGGAGRVDLKDCRFRGSRECGVNGMKDSRLSIQSCAFEGNQTALSLRDRSAADLRKNRAHDNKLVVFAGGNSRVNLWKNVFGHGQGADVDLCENAEVHCLKLFPLEAAPVAA